VPDFDSRVPHIARIYDYWLGGKDNFAADREAAEKAMAATPTIVPGVRANRRFLGRTVRYLAQAGIRQFLDVGTGIPPRTTRTRLPSPWPPRPGWCMSITTRSCSATHGPF
jgi:hypothetical protein